MRQLICINRLSAWQPVERPPAGVRGHISVALSVEELLADQRREFAKG
jgi:hypothetical protein